MKNGLLLVDKPTGCTSHDVVGAARRLVGQKKIGHCGTLDPDATGLLLLTLGQATRLTRFLIRAPKVYQGTIAFGSATDTYDATGTVLREVDTAGLDLPAIAAAMEGFVGMWDQTPPPYCAKKIGGKKYYELARRGEEVPTDSKEVEVFSFSPIGELEEDRLDFELGCASGTYARSLAHELGERLGNAAHLCRLRRTLIGNLRVEHAMTLDQLEDLEGDIESASCFIPFDEIPLPFAAIEADSQQERRIVHGQTVLVDRLELEEGDWVRVVNGRRNLVAVGTVIETVGNRGVGVVQPRIVFN